MKKLITLLLFLVLALPAVAFAEKPVLMMSTTTSTDNTGLLDVLKPAFEAETGIELRWTAVGTGKALAMGQNCDVDVLLVHAPGAEKKFVADGYGVDRTQLMYNDFVIIGPAADPAKVKGMSVSDALKKIGQSGNIFCSRGDNSGTHKKELSLWKESGMAVPEKEAWYVQTGQGMLPTINVANEKNAYTMTDRGTFIKYEASHNGNPPIVILVEGDGALFNQYSAMAVNPKNCPNAKYDLAKKYIDWMASDATQKLIGDFKLMGKQLFTPNAGK
ncbi:substrate-binding domain-containing protein [Desulfovibrio subterraneus]|jgi:tungstate transport system substrate-binding protein|uniref:Tungsten ABC transporter substrate-binding protein n=1 Tax=Desulfovibrio subterraneus TaxID=2718620 RepID=A0A7J0BGA7_9BACT|nr:substrate-binding domain-containing protein [Desulfovibrio subterraneus]WBF67041.1 substrate-binding domain-containing protein [Desulfovibrio subterraneus]GFM32773.1 tungsten ABC transporter substrate-binding protein [Desulfovibrio subterraneus]